MQIDLKQIVLNVIILLLICLFGYGVKGGIENVKNDGALTQSDPVKSVSINPSKVPSCDTATGIGMAKEYMNNKLQSRGTDIQISAYNRGSNAAVLSDEVIDIDNATQDSFVESENVRTCSGMAETKLSGRLAVSYSFRLLHDGTIRTEASVKPLNQQTAYMQSIAAGVPVKAEDYLKEQPPSKTPVANQSSTTAHTSSDNAHYDDDGDDDKLDAEAGYKEDESCGASYPCRLHEIIDDKDWIKVSSAIAFGMQLNSRDAIKWSDKRPGHKGTVKQIGDVDRATHCRIFRVTSSNGAKTGTDDITVCAGSGSEYIYK